MYRTILVPLDGSRRAEAILSHAALIGRQNRALLVLLKVEDAPVLLHRDEVVDVGRYHEMLEQRRKHAYAYLSDIQAQFDNRDIRSDIRVVHGAVVKSVLETADSVNADLIAMATHGWSGLARVSYGSVAAGVLQAAEIPILLIRSGDDMDVQPM